MPQVRIFSVMLLLAAVLTLHITTPQRHIVYIPAIDVDVKVRPVDLPSPVPPVVSLIEADRRVFKEKAKQPPSAWDQPMPYKDHGLTLDANDGQECWLNNCDLELDLKLAKFHIVEFFSS
nr:hypothetical protein 3 [Alphaproteobacteria bacterium]